MIRCLSFFLVAAVVTSRAHGAADATIEYKHILLKGHAAQVLIALDGGAITDFHLRNHGLNPLSWKEEGERAKKPPWRGHFLCLDRWGDPSAAEREKGMPVHGEAARLSWRVLSNPTSAGGSIRAEMAVDLPLAGLAVKRSIALSQREAIFTVREEVTNTNRLGRIYTMVQHPTIAPPFLDETTVVDANGRKGFMTYRPMPNPEEPAVSWPQALKDGEPVNVRFLSDEDDPNVVSYTLDDEYGWYTAYNPARGLLLGYIWKSADYPWLIDWRSAENGKPMARGLEFGTTALPHPFSVLVAKGRIFDRPLYEYLDAGETAVKSYAVFLLEIPADYRGIHDIAYDGGRLVIHERMVLYELHAGPDRDLVMEVGELFP